ncbi:MAG: glutamine--fructose-6-phosphate transaminase (isomerizing) [Nanoarchaeota archaeon]
MCGIFGYIGPKDMKEVLIGGLKRLEYRGYDSAGIATLEPQLRVIRSEGKISALEEKLVGVELKGHIGIAHTRWATHGEPTERNAHPQTCETGLAIVHNGIIENYHTLRQWLSQNGHTFTSDTDSEVIAHLIGHIHRDNGDFFTSVQKALTQLQGTYGLAIIKEGLPEIIAAANGSPLILGIGDHEFFVSSDAIPLNDHTKRIVILDDKEAVRITANSYTVTDLDNNELKKAVERITWDVEKINLGGHTHYMHKEIHEQPETIKNAFRGRLSDEGIRLDGLRELENHPIERIRLLACGTSWHSALIGKYLLEAIARIPTEVDYASEFRYRNPVIGSHELVIGISQSGETLDTLEALKLAKEHATTFGIVNVVGSKIARETKAGIYTHAGPEIGVASTKAFTGQVTCLYMLALELARQRNELFQYEEHKSALERIPDLISAILAQEDALAEIAQAYAPHNNALYLGRGINFPVALEGALKLKEISGIHAEGYPAAEMKHGPIALIDKNMPVVFIVNPNDTATYEKVLSNISEVATRKGKIIAITSREDEQLLSKSSHVIYVPETTEYLAPLVNVIPLQLLAYHMAVLRGKNPDKPDNLAKAVTVD